MYAGINEYARSREIGAPRQKFPHLSVDLSIDMREAESRSSSSARASGGATRYTQGRSTNAAARSGFRCARRKSRREPRDRALSHRTKDTRSRRSESRCSYRHCGRRYTEWSALLRLRLHLANNRRTGERAPLVAAIARSYAHMYICIARRRYITSPREMDARTRDVRRNDDPRPPAAPASSARSEHLNLSSSLDLLFSYLISATFSPACTLSFPFRSAPSYSSLALFYYRLILLFCKCDACLCVRMIWRGIDLTTFECVSANYSSISTSSPLYLSQHVNLC